jgi:hypothetical protein
MCDGTTEIDRHYAQQVRPTLCPALPPSSLSRALSLSLSLSPSLYISISLPLSPSLPLPLPPSLCPSLPLPLSLPLSLSLSRSLSHSLSLPPSIFLSLYLSPLRLSLAVSLFRRRKGRWVADVTRPHFRALGGGGGDGAQVAGLTFAQNGAYQSLRGAAMILGGRLVKPLLGRLRTWRFTSLCNGATEETLDAAPTDRAQLTEPN